MSKETCPRAAEWKYLDDGVTLMRAALAAIPERYRDGDPNQLHYAIKEWLERVHRMSKETEYDPGREIEESEDKRSDWDPYEAAGESPFGLPGVDRSL